MPFPRRLLIPDEQLVLDLRPHPVALVMPTLVTIVGFVAASWLTAKTDVADWVWWVLFLILLVLYPVPKLIAWLTSNFAVTSDRVIHRQGFIAKRSMEIPLEAINDVRFEQGILDRMVGAGTLVISSASEFGRNTFDDIRHPEAVQKVIYEQGESNKKRMYQGSAAGQGPPPPPPAAPSATTELERLVRLRADGVLSEEEFQVQKAKILGQG
ncbi:MAG TPA: PH domain-containing protein [Actinomycetota bacterium]|jgi:membrane protein YdbS with pleckstrin-like domain|nr:PH domain-containing protein [Actinomycetota bacterium]